MKYAIFLPSGESTRERERERDSEVQTWNFKQPYKRAGERVRENIGQVRAADQSEMVKLL